LLLLEYYSDRTPSTSQTSKPKSFSQKAIPTERFAIAPPPTSQTAIPTERFAIALPQPPQTAIAPPQLLK